MSFYDLTKNSVLSAQELFKYRVKRDTTIPSKGGQKQFEPDGSWIQSKALEAFMQERTSILAEPRVEKLKSLVEGVWDTDHGLINLKKPGKFWAHMGFTDQRRNWLYPEEALFLMESNRLDVYHKGVRLSIQEAYNMFLGREVSIEEYQVFSHLRRLGYVVLRHEEQPVITAYERQINLDKYISKQSRKDRKGKSKQKGKQLKQFSENNARPLGDNDNSKSKCGTSSNAVISSDTGAGEADLNIWDKDKITREEVSCNETSERSLDNIDMLAETQKQIESLEPELEVTSCLSTDSTNVFVEKTSNNESSSNEEKSDGDAMKSRKRQNSDENCPNHSSSKKILSEELIATEDIKNIHSYAELTNSSVSETISDLVTKSLPSRFYENHWSFCFKILSEQKTNNDKIPDKSEDEKSSKAEKICTESSSQEIVLRNSSDVPVPNIADTSMVSLVIPHCKLLPNNVEINANQDGLLFFDVEDYRLKYPHQQLNRRDQKEEEKDSRIRGLKFSFAEWTQKKLNITAKNWKEYKEKCVERMAKISSSTPVDHLWNGKVTPLVRPEDAWSYQNILDRLSIIKSAENEKLLPDSDCVVDVKIAYDVHLPDSRFRKSMPGVPNHRVCVVKFSSEPPGLGEIQQVWSRYKDRVPLHWAVVDSGEIAFYSFDNLHSVEVLS